METLSLRKQALLYIVASLDEELASLRRDIAALEPSGGVGFPVEIHRVGVGPERAGEAMAGLLANARRRPQGVLMLGVAGAVQLGMETGEMLLAESYALDPAVGRSGAGEARPGYAANGGRGVGGREDAGKPQQLADR